MVKTSGTRKVDAQTAYLTVVLCAFIAFVFALPGETQHTRRRAYSKAQSDALFAKLLKLDTADQGYHIFPGGGLPYRGMGSKVVSSNNQVRCFQDVLEKELAASDIQIVVRTAYATRVVGIAVYSADGNTRLLQSGAISVATTGMKKATLGTPVTLEPEAYWYCWTTDFASVQLQATLADSNFDSLFDDTVPQMGTSSETSSGGVMPATLGTITYGSFAIPFAKIKP